MSIRDDASFRDSLGNLIRHVLGRSVLGSQPSPGARDRLMARASQGASTKKRSRWALAEWRGNLETRYEYRFSWPAFMTLSAMGLLQTGLISHRLLVR